MFDSGLVECIGDCSITSKSNSGHPASLPVADTTTAAFCAVLRFLYTDAVKLKETSVLDMAYLSQRYLVTALHKHCLAYCVANVSPANKVGWRVVADNHTITGLRAMLIKYVANNLAEIGAALPDTQATLTVHPLIMFACFKVANFPPAAKRRKIGN